ncbi:MAG: GTPase HflX [Phycisphaerae bacterium]|nr:GTPase HflX [Phycisphaerae bacterium]
MEQSKREELTVQQERTMLVGVLLPGSSADPMDPLGELRSLARTAGADVVDEIVAKRDKPHPGLYIGTGKADLIAQRVEQNEVECLIFDNDLSPGQIRDLEKIVECKVLDRSELILDIFATHARTHQSRLQVELAQLEYTYPRLTGMWQHLDRHGGAAASSGGMGTRGPGETQIETDRRLVQKRVQMLKQKLAAIDRRKLREVKNRSDAFCVCLVGYTNAGKSTLMNLLTGADAYVADQLFATLETKTRRWNLNGAPDVLLSDTVGFVRDLPHHLVASFRATLEEAIYADLLIHVADASHERVDEEIRAVDVVLDELGCDRSRSLLVLNKIDKIVDPTVHTVLRNGFPAAISLSAATGQGAEELIEAVRRRAGGFPVRVKLHANVRNGRLMHYIAQHADVETQTYDDTVACIQAVIAETKLDQLRQFGDDVAILDQAGA